MVWHGGCWKKGESGKKGLDLGEGGEETGKNNLITVEYSWEL